MNEPTVKRAEVLEDLVPTPKYSALLFDWDGTVADSQGVNFEVLCEAMAGHDLRLDREWFDSHTGTSTADAIRLVAAEQGKSADPDLIADQRNALFLNRVADVDLVDHMRDLIDGNQGRLKMAVASGGDGNCLMATLNARNYRSSFDAIVTRDDVSAGKPSPEIFRKAANLLDVAPSECLVYEDSDEGIEAARLANMDVIDVRPLRRAVLGY